VTLIPILRGALPMYVAAYPLFSDSDSILVRCSKDKELHGPESVIVEWMGRKPLAHAAHGDGHARGQQLPEKGVERRHLVILDTVLATGDTVVKLCNELHALQSSPSETREVGPGLITVLSCYASPQALAAVAAHLTVGLIFVAHRAERVDEHGYLVPAVLCDSKQTAVLYRKKDV
jgi:4a-hydroxytetrahydrobiopterin dehydratase